MDIEMHTLAVVERPVAVVERPVAVVERPVAAVEFLPPVLQLAVLAQIRTTVPPILIRVV
jgi:hypothetical protein